MQQSFYHLWRIYFGDGVIRLGWEIYRFIALLYLIYCLIVVKIVYCKTTNSSILSSRGTLHLSLSFSLNFCLSQHRHWSESRKELPAFTCYASTQSSRTSSGEASATVLPELLLLLISISQGMLLLPLPPPRFPSACGTRGGADRDTSGEAEETTVRSAASGSDEHGNHIPG